MKTKVEKRCPISVQHRVPHLLPNGNYELVLQTKLTLFNDTDSIVRISDFKLVIPENQVSGFPERREFEYASAGIEQVNYSKISKEKNTVSIKAGSEVSLEFSFFGPSNIDLRNALIYAISMKFYVMALIQDDWFALGPFERAPK